jgi:hypothetical protein
MATPIYIGLQNTKVYQVEQPLNLNPDGSAQASITFKVNVNMLQAQQYFPNYLDDHPSFPGLKAYETSATQENGIITSVTTTYHGVLANNSELKNLAQIEYSRVLSEAPIETHPRYAFPLDDPPITKFDIDAIELALQNCTGLPSLIQNGPNESDKAAPSELCEELFKKKRKGIESYYKLGSTYRISYCSPDPPEQSLINKIGKQFNSLDSPAPAPPQDQAYLLMGVSWTRRAGVVNITEDYQLSGVGGWDPDLYPLEGA